MKAIVRVLNMNAEVEIIDNKIVFFEFTDKAQTSQLTNPLLLKLQNQLDEYTHHHLQDFNIPLAFTGTTFQEEVWSALCTIPYGEVRTYKEIAQQIKRPKAYRAVGMACNKNPVGLLIPCHRVIGSNGNLVGYAGGLDLKEKLLKHEKRL